MKRRIVSSLVAAMAIGVMAETVNTVTVTKFHQSYPYTGRATVEYTVGGSLPANAVAEFTINTDNASAPRALADHGAAPLALALATLALATFTSAAETVENPAEKCYINAVLKGNQA